MKKKNARGDTFRVRTKRAILEGNLTFIHYFLKKYSVIKTPGEIHSHNIIYLYTVLL